MITKQRQANYAVGGRSAIKWNLVVARSYADNELITKLSKVGAQVRYMEDQLVMNCEQQDAKVRLEGKSARLIQVISNIIKCIEGPRAESIRTERARGRGLGESRTVRAASPGHARY